MMKNITICLMLLLPLGLFAQATFNVTFTVDMKSYGQTFTTPEVNGTFNGWCGNCNPLTETSPGVWSTTIPLQAGSMEYKFAHDSWAGQENLTQGLPCVVTNGGFTNRPLELVSDTVLAVVDWNSCDQVITGVQGSTVEYSSDVAYPNPTAGNLSVDLSAKHGQVNWSLKSLAGESLQAGVAQGSETFELEIEQQAGVYLLEIIEQNGDVTLTRVLKN